MKCARCDKDMEHKGTGSNFIGSSIEVRLGVFGDKEFYQKQMGKYKLNHPYNFCWECWLDSLMGDKALIDKLIKEMLDDCPICQGSGVNIEKDDNPPEEVCDYCDGGKTLSYEGEKLRQLILKGRLP